jgi:hypothetical protein
MTTAAVPLALAVILVASPATAMAANGVEPRAEARERFDRGLRLFEEGDSAGALAEFKRAHELVPNPLVLFNIGLVYAALARPVEATDALERVLRDPGGLPADKLERARRTRDEQAGRIARIAVTTSVPAVIDVDGVEAGRTPLAAPLRIAGGAHVIGVVAMGHLPSRREITVAGGESKEIGFELVATESRLAHLAVESALPGADVLVDGTLVGRTPLPASLAVAPGTRVVTVRRLGYREVRQELSLAEGATGNLRVELEEDPNAPLGGKGRLALQLRETEMHVAVNGRTHGVYAGPLALPAGPHHLRLDRAGFVSSEREVALRAGEETTLRITLDPTPETRLAHVERVQARTRWGWIAAGGGLALALGGGATAWWSQRTLPELEHRLDKALNDYTGGSETDCDTMMALTREMHDVCEARIEDADSQLSNRRLLRTLGVVGAGVGVAAVAIGIYLLLTNDDARKYDRPASALSFLPSPWLYRGGAGADLRVSF